MSTEVVTPNASDPNGQRIVYLEVGRGLAALFVVCFHSTIIIGLEKYYGVAPLNGFFSFGYAGVDFFFVLSGFIIYYSTSSNHGNLQFVSDYLKHRLIRIYPIYWLVALLLLPMSTAFSPWPGTINVIMDLLLWPRGSSPFVPVAWTLIHEMLFYVSFLLFFISVGVAWVYFLSWSFLIAMASAFAWNIGSPFWELYLNMHNIEFVLGMLVAAYLRVGGCVPFWCLFVGGGGFLSAGVNASILNTGIATTIPQYHLLYGFSSVLLIAGLATRVSMCVGGGLLRGFIFLGKASYSIYLIHFAVLSATIKLLGSFRMGGTVTFTILIVLGVMVGVLIYQYVERPLLKYVRRKMKVVNHRG